MSSFQRELNPQAEEDEVTAPFRPRPFCVYKGHTADLLDLSWSKVCVCIKKKNVILTSQTFGSISESFMKKCLPGYRCRLKTSWARINSRQKCLYHRHKPHLLVSSHVIQKLMSWINGLYSKSEKHPFKSLVSVNDL